MSDADAWWLLGWMYLLVGCAFALTLGWAIEANRDKIEREMARENAGRLGWVSMSMIVVFAAVAWPVALLWMNKGRTRQ